MISIITDSFFDDITGIIYLMTFKDSIRLFPTGIGYTRPKTSLNVCLGLQKWGTKLKQNTDVASSDNTPLNPNCYFPLNDTDALNFGTELAKYLKLNKNKTKPTKLKIKGDILVLGPYNTLGKHLKGKHNIYSSFSNIHFTNTGSFPSVINIGIWSNAGIDPCSTLITWTHRNSILLARQPPIDLVLETLDDVNTWAAIKIKKILNYSKQHNPGGGFVWDLGLALIYKNPDLIVRNQLYDVTMDSENKITLTLTMERNTTNTQVYLVDVDINEMMVRLKTQLLHY